MHMFSDQIPVGRDVYVAITFDEVKPPLSLSERLQERLVYLLFEF